MRITEFWRRMEHHFGVAYADSYARDQVLRELGGRTVQEALAAGDDLKVVWRAVCSAANVPDRER
ncbi:MAG: hypothetical protein QOJ83_2227 [Frankiales bacterium]|jgi:hypothetical protein|nr:hypothetical protein [Frankiales bacterium]MDX6222858.1 hypothetical protein [Frankiales bacterium]